jgi:DGQHR domain-containing protein
MMAKTPATISFPCIPLQQGTHKLFVFSASAKKLWSVVKINQRDEDKDTGYQRLLSASRLRALTRYVDSGNPIPTSVLISFDKKYASLSSDGRQLIVKNVPNAGWVIDGQHRLAGAHAAKKDIDLATVAFIDLDDDAQVEQFVTINREAKGVPTSLYYDLLKKLPGKSAADQAKERAADLASELKKDEDSAFFGRIVVTTAPKKGELSLNNFVRKVAPLVSPGKPLHEYNTLEQAAILRNYFQGLKTVFPSKFGMSSVFFQTLGFGALINALPTALNLSIKHYKGFTVANVAQLFGEIKHFAFDDWAKAGTGSAAEIQAGEDLKQELKNAFADADGGVATSINLGL